MRFKYVPSRVAGRRSPNLAGVIYGTILATALVAGYGQGWFGNTGNVGA
jgi:hypothetical protein